MKYKGKLNLSPVTYTTGMKNLYGNLSLWQSEQVRISVTRVVLRGSNGHGICCVQHSLISGFGETLFLSSDFVEEIRNFFPQILAEFQNASSSMWAARQGNIWSLMFYVTCN